MYSVFQSIINNEFDRSFGIHVEKTDAYYAGFTYHLDGEERADCFA